MSNVNRKSRDTQYPATTNLQIGSKSFTDTVQKYPVSREILTLPWVCDVF